MKSLVPVTGVAAVVLLAWNIPSPSSSASPSSSPSESPHGKSPSAQVLWDGDASNGLDVFGTTLCDSPGSVTVDDWGGSRGDIFKFNKPVGVPRCEAHNVRTDQGEYPFQDGRTYWFGWDSMTKTGDAQTVFQWKSNGANDEHSQNYPILMKVEDGKLKVWYVAPGEEWISIGSAPWTAAEWHSVELGITASAGDTGKLSVYLDGKQIASRTGARTWDDLGNKPRWGTYGGTDSSTASINWIDGLKMGTARSDVD